MKVELGDLVKDKISGFEGIVTGYTTWLTGCDRVVVQPRELRSGEYRGLASTESFDITMVDIVKKGVIKPNRLTDSKRPQKEEKGGPMPTPKPW